MIFLAELALLAVLLEAAFASRFFDPRIINIRRDARDVYQKLDEARDQPKIIDLTSGSSNEFSIEVGYLTSPKDDAAFHESFELKKLELVPAGCASSERLRVKFSVKEADDIPVLNAAPQKLDASKLVTVSTKHSSVEQYCARIQKCLRIPPSRVEVVQRLDKFVVGGTFSMEVGQTFGDPRAFRYSHLVATFGTQDGGRLVELRVPRHLIFRLNSPGNAPVDLTASQQEQFAAKHHDQTCALCLDDIHVTADAVDDAKKLGDQIDGYEQISILSKCNHAFHRHCVTRAIDATPFGKAACPLCRAGIRPWRTPFDPAHVRKFGGAITYADITASCKPVERSESV